MYVESEKWEFEYRCCVSEFEMSLSVVLIIFMKYLVRINYFF